MTISRQHSTETLVDALVAQHAPLVGYAVTGLRGRLPQTARPEPLVAAGMEGLRAAAESYMRTRTSNAEGAPDFARYAKPRIAAALGDAVAGAEVATRETGTPQIVTLVAQVEPVLHTDEELLLHTAHRAAFAGEPQRPVRGAGHYAAVAAASDFRSSLDGQEATAMAPQRKFGA